MTAQTNADVAVRDVLNVDHARLGPSNHRWPNCPGSVRVEAAYPDTAGEAAIDGTGSHLLLEMCLDNAVRAEAYQGQVIGRGHKDNPLGWIVDQDRVLRVQMALDYVSRRYTELLAQFPNSIVEIESETKSDPGNICRRTDWWGTVDITITVKDARTAQVKFIEVADYKDGRGWVPADNNSQLISYLSGKMAPHVYMDMGRIMDARMLQGVRMTIIQPKTNPVIRYSEPEPQEVARAHHKLSLAAYKTDDENAPLIAGKHCQWCKHKPNCTAQSEQDVQRILPMINTIPIEGQQSLFEVVQATFGNIEEMDSAKLAELADAEAGIQAIFERAKGEIQRRIEAGQTVSGWTMAPGRASRVWNVDEEEVAKILKGRKLKKDQIYPAKLISPAQVMKHPDLSDAQKKAIEEKYISTMEGKLSLQKVAHENKVKDSVDMFKDVVPQLDTTSDDVKQIDESITMSFL